MPLPLTYCVVGKHQSAFREPIRRFRGAAFACILLAASAATSCSETAPRSEVATHHREPVRFDASKPSSAAYFELTKEPIGLLQVTTDGALVQVRFRFNRALPQDVEGPRAEVLIGAAGADAPPQAFGIRSRHCYAVVIGNDFDEPVLRGAGPGSRVPLSVRVPRSGAGVRITTRLTLRSFRASTASLDCGRR